MREYAAKFMSARQKGGMRVYFFCPDRHIVYDGRTADRTGVGGGITVRLRMAAALAQRGMQVTLACNCLKEQRYHGVRYVPLDAVKEIDTDVLIVHSTGGACDVSSLASLPVQAGIRILLVDGVSPPHGAEHVQANWIYACSNFIAKVVREGWNLPEPEILVSHHGVKRPAPALLPWPLLPRSRRDSYRLIYSSHPSKGLETALAVTRQLRRQDSKFVLHVYGGDALWGGTAPAPPDETGVVYHGLAGQKELMKAYQHSGFALHMQSREEPFGISLAESMAAGCIVVASPVGAYRELVNHNCTGLLIQGDHESEQSRNRAAESILKLVSAPAEAHDIRERGAAFPLDWDTVAGTWIGHWSWLQAGRQMPRAEACRVCAGTVLPLADGAHCLRCSHFAR